MAQCKMKNNLNHGYHGLNRFHGIHTSLPNDSLLLGVGCWGILVNPLICVICGSDIFCV